MTRFVVARRGGQRAQLHVAVQRAGHVETACGKRLLLDGRTVLSTRAPWDDDRANRCLTCSRKTSVAPSTRTRRPVR